MQSAIPLRPSVCPPAGCLSDTRFSCVEKTESLHANSPCCANAHIHLILAYLGRVHIPNGIAIGSAVFAQLTAESIVYNGSPLPLKSVPFAGVIWAFVGPSYLGRLESTLLRVVCMCAQKIGSV